MEKRVLITLFGATGDLAKRKLFPSLFRLYKKGEIKEHFAVIGTARRTWDDAFFRNIVVDSLKELSDDLVEKEAFASHFFYQSHDVQDQKNYATLKALSEKLAETYQTKGNKLFYLAMAPQFFSLIAQHLKTEKIIVGRGFERLIIEKPFGEDYASAKSLNDSLSIAFEEKDIFRIDHYLGKEMIQNVAAVRFGNNIFESLWSNQYIDNIQITFAESLGVEDRGGYYEKSGALKDMVQNHILQVLSLLAMEPPRKFEEDCIFEQKVLALKSIRKYNEKEALENFIPAQYVDGKIEDTDYIAYRKEPNVAEDSTTETFVAGKFLIDNFRWSGVPFYVRTGKRLVEKGTRINVVFKKTAMDIFSNTHENNLAQNILTIYIQPTEGFSLEVNGKRLGQNFEVEPLRLSFRHEAEILGNSPEAYEKLLLDALNGDRSNFSHWNEVARSWELIDVIKQAWEKNIQTLPTYRARTMGPKEADDLLKKDGRHWVWTPQDWYVERGLLEEN